MFSFLLKHKYMKKDGEPHVKLEGRDTENWKCIDFGKGYSSSKHKMAQLKDKTTTQFK